MRVMRRIFEMVGVEGSSTRALRRILEAEGLRTPGGRKRWSQMFVRSEILDDVYRPLYRMIGLAATITMDGTLEVKGACEEGDSCCGMEMRYSTP